MFLNDAKSPANPTKEVAICADAEVVKPIDVAISPKLADISKAVASAIPKDSKEFFANSLTCALLDLKATSTLFKLSV